MTGAGAAAARAPGRALTRTERLMVGVVLGALIHAALLLFLELAVRIPWPQPRTYLGSVTVELEAPEPKPAPAPVAREPPPAAAAVVRPAQAPRQPSPQPSPQPAAQPPATAARPAPLEPPMTAPRSAEPPAAVIAPSPAPQADAGGRENAIPTAGAHRPPVAVAQAPLGGQASREVAPVAEVAAPFDPFARTTETRSVASAPAPEPVTPLAQSRGGAQGSAVGPAAGGVDAGGSLLDRLDKLGTGTPAASGPAAGSGAGARASPGALPLVDPGGRYQIRNPELEKGGRGLLTYVEPDLAGVEASAARMTVEVKVLVASSGEVMDPRVVRHATNPVIDARILQAVRRWQFTPASSGTAMVEATVTFTIIPKP